MCDQDSKDSIGSDQSQKGKNGGNESKISADNEILARLNKLTTDFEKFKKENKSKNKVHPQRGLKSKDLYALETACEILRIGETRMLEIRRGFVGKGITRIGNGYFCYGHQFINILMQEHNDHE